MTNEEYNINKVKIIGETIQRKWDKRNHQAEQALKELSKRQRKLFVTKSRDKQL